MKILQTDRKGGMAEMAVVLKQYRFALNDYSKPHNKYIRDVERVGWGAVSWPCKVKKLFLSDEKPRNVQRKTRIESLGQWYLILSF